MSPNITEILNVQIESLIHLPPTLPKTIILDLPEDNTESLIYYSKLSNKKYPYFFITGQANRTSPAS